MYVKAKKFVRKIVGRAKKFRSRVLYNFPNDQLFPSSVLLHFSYHKCLTAYYNRIMRDLAEDFDFYRHHFSSDVSSFEKNVLNYEQKCVLSVNNSSVLQFNKYPSYKGSHFIRDPRDLLVSGYRYHLRTKERWCHNANFDWTSIVNHPYFAKYIENKNDNWPSNISYQNYLKSLDFEKGMIVELIWRQKHFVQMQKWDFNNERIIEKKYEEIIGNEIDSFEEIFHHYELHPKLINRGLELVEKYSLENQRGKIPHIRKGSPNQWDSEFTVLHKQLFKELNGGLLVTLDYERDLQW